MTSALQVNMAARGPPPFPGAPLLSSPGGGPLLPAIRYGPPPQLCGPFGPRPLPPPFGTSPAGRSGTGRVCAFSLGLAVVGTGARAGPSGGKGQLPEPVLAFPSVSQRTRSCSPPGLSWAVGIPWPRRGCLQKVGTGPLPPLPHTRPCSGRS